MESVVRMNISNIFVKNKHTLVNLIPCFFRTLGGILMAKIKLALSLFANNFAHKLLEFMIILFKNEIPEYERNI